MRQAVVVYLYIVITIWQLSYPADRVLPIPDGLISLLPVIGLLAYAVSIFAHPHLADRLVVVGVMLCAATILWANRPEVLGRVNTAKHDAT